MPTKYEQNPICQRIVYELTAKHPLTNPQTERQRHTQRNLSQMTVAGKLAAWHRSWPICDSTYNISSTLANYTMETHIIM